MMHNYLDHLLKVTLITLAVQKLVIYRLLSQIKIHKEFLIIVGAIS